MTALNPLSPDPRYLEETRTVNCPECGGSGYRWGFDREIECFDCGGEGQWEEPLTSCDGDPFLKHNRRDAA